MNCPTCGHPESHHCKGSCYTDTKGRETWGKAACQCTLHPEDIEAIFRQQIIESSAIDNASTPWVYGDDRP